MMRNELASYTDSWQVWWPSVEDNRLAESDGSSGCIGHEKAGKRHEEFMTC